MKEEAEQERINRIDQTKATCDLVFGNITVFFNFSSEAVEERLFVLSLFRKAILLQLLDYRALL